ncbi:MAG: GGDEF domain-containing protein, partial [Leptospiraceae bacterium]|nr:GGDEF domain-containing protein [Leptospiraceae bacterium]
DIVLEGTAKFSRDKLRSFDQIGRYGGEEFLIILPDTNIDQAYKLINQIRIELSQKKWKINNLIVTFSGGLSETRFDDSEDGFDLLKRADELLYKAKNSGRNKI